MPCFKSTLHPLMHILQLVSTGGRTRDTTLANIKKTYLNIYILNEPKNGYLTRGCFCLVKFKHTFESSGRLLYHLQSRQHLLLSLPARHTHRAKLLFCSNMNLKHQPNCTECLLPGRDKETGWERQSVGESSCIETMGTWVQIPRTHVTAWQVA